VGAVRSLMLIQALLGIAVVTRHSPAAEPMAIDFQRDVAPIFEQHCVRCHHADDARGDVSVATKKICSKGATSSLAERQKAIAEADHVAAAGETAANAERWQAVDGRPSRDSSPLDRNRCCLAGRSGDSAACENGSIMVVVPATYGGHPASGQRCSCSVAAKPD